MASASATRVAGWKVNPGAAEIDGPWAKRDRACTSADPIAGLDDEHLGTGTARRIGGRQACNTRSDHDDAHGLAEATGQTGPFLGYGADLAPANEVYR